MTTCSLVAKGGMHAMIALYNAFLGALRCIELMVLRRGLSKNLECIRCNVVWENDWGSVRR